MKTTNHIIIGRIGSTYGVHGWLKIIPYTEFTANILTYSPWYLAEGEDKWRQIVVEDSKTHNNGLIVKLEGIENPEEGRLLTGKKITITRDQLPVLEKDEYYWSDLIGLSVINKDGTLLGKVSYLIETGSNDVLVVKGEKEHAIPFLLDDVILSVDLQKQEIQVDWEPI